MKKLILNKQKSLLKNKENSNELISGQTFYKFFRKNSGTSQRKLKTSLGLKKGKLSSSMFDNKNMNSLFIMSKTMGGTKEGFFKHKNNNIAGINQSPIKEENEHKKENIIINNINNINQSEEQKVHENIIIKNNNINYKPLIILSDTKKENDKNNSNLAEVNKEKSLSKFYNNVDEYNHKENILYKGFSFSNRYNPIKENKKIYNIFNKNKTKTRINFFNYNGNGLYKSYKKENQKTKNFDYDESIKFPVIRQNVGNNNSNLFNNNFIFNNKLEEAFRKTANSFNFNNKLTIHDLK